MPSSSSHHKHCSLPQARLVSHAPSAAASRPFEIDFSDHQSAYKDKSFFELTRALVVFKLCSIQPLVRNSKSLLDLSYSTLGRSITNALLSQTMYGHFCAGESREQLQNVVSRLSSSKVGAVLDYAAEDEAEDSGTSDSETDILSDMNERVVATKGTREEDYRQFHGPVSQVNNHHVSARTYSYSSEAKCDANCQIFLECIESAASVGDGGYAAIKLTALANPILLQRLSLVLQETRRIFRSIATTDRVDPLTDMPSKQYLDLSISFDNFKTYLERIGFKGSSDMAHEMFVMMDKNNDERVSYLGWLDALDPRLEKIRSLLCSELDPPSSDGDSAAVHRLPSLTEEEVTAFHAMYRRVHLLAQTASERRVRLMVDAEHSWYQPAIDHMVAILQSEYNRDFPVVYQTYQCYLTDSYGRLHVDLERCRRHGYHFAAKLVRGAYMYQERERADEMKYRSPVYADKAGTDNNYDRIITTLTEDMTNRHVMVASHNENSVRHMIQRMAEMGIANDDKRVAFAQLLGMCDHVTFSLGQFGYNAFKYTPYGPIHEAMPYLIRRAEENSDFMGGVQRDRELLWTEWKRRLFMRK